MADSDKDALAAEVMHELRQPLLALKAWLQLSKEDPGRVVPLDLLLTQVERLEHIIGDYHRLTHQRAAPKERLKLSTVARAAIASTVRPNSNGSPIELEVVFDVEVVGNPRLLEQLVLNLINNARDASSGQARVKVVVSRDGVKPALLVADWGSGISESVKQKLFEPYVTTKGAAGMGLGLVVCRRIADEHRATLDLGSPAALNESPPPATVFRVVFEADGTASTGTKQFRVLVVDDENTIRLMFRDLLSKEHQVIDAPDAESAIELLKQNKFDLVIADKNLPGKSGLELAQEAKKLHPPIKVMLMTGYPSLVTAQQSVELGLVDYLTKPFDDIRALRDKIRTVLNAPAHSAKAAGNKRVDVYEDNPVSARQISEALTLIGMQPNVLDRAIPGGQEAPAAVVISWDFAPAHGAAAVRLAKQFAPGTPFVVLAEHLTMDSAIESLRAGAQACLPKLLSDVKALSRELQRSLGLS